MRLTMREEEDRACALRLRWVELSDDQRELHLDTLRLRTSTDTPALSAHAARLHDHNARMRLLIEDLHAFHRAYGRGVGLPPSR